MGVEKILSAALAVVLAVGVVPSAAAGANVPPATFADAQRREKLAKAFPELDRIAQRWLDERGAPGIAWGVVIDGELAKFGSAGFRDVERKAPIDADTVFRIASMTKSVTALAILMLRDQGKLELDAPVSRYVPELASLAPPTQDSGSITVRHLLTHTAGFPEDNPWGDRQLAVSDEQLSRWLAAGIPFSTGTGSAYEYSNYGFAVLGRIVANVSGMAYREFMNTRVLAPLDMRSSFWDPTDVPKARLAIGYRQQDGRFLPESPLADGAFGSMGGLFTSSRDLARWVGWMLAAFPPRDDPEAPPALRRSVRELQQGAGYPTLFARRGPGAPAEAFAGVYAFGLRAARACDLGRQVGHSGGLPGFGSYMLWLPDSGVGAFGMANLTYGAPSAMVRDMLGALARTGGLEPRRASPSPALEDATHRLAHLVDDWSDAKARAIAADNLFLDESLERRREALGALRKDLGSCAAGAIDAENALRGSFRMRCERGWLDVAFTLAPTNPPTVQYLEVRRGRPLGPAMQQSLGAVMVALTRGPRGLDLVRTADRDSIGALLAATRETYGACRAGEPEEGDGQTSARVRLECDGGPLDLEITRRVDRIESIRFSPPPDAVCTP